MLFLTSKECFVLDLHVKSLPLSSSRYCVVCSSRLGDRDVVYVERFDRFRELLVSSPSYYSDIDRFRYTLVELI